MSISFNLKDHFAKELPADPDKSNQRRQVFKACFSYVHPRTPSQPRLIHFSEEAAELLGISSADANEKDFLDIFSGIKTIPNSTPYAMCYGGHQFGHWAGQLGDGRAINLGEVLHQEKSWQIQLKGAGATPYSRTADGLAVLRSSIREHLCSEAMFHLGVPTTRSLSICLTGDSVLRDVLYDGNPAYEAGAVVCRVAPTFIRFGNFQILAARGDLKNLKILTDYTISHHFPHINNTKDKTAYLQFFLEVVQSSIQMVLSWQRVGFVHGVMNTDNMSILGQTIDYGPYGWLEGYDIDWTPNTTDRQQRRYRFGNQPHVVFWNLYQLANALYPLIEDAEPFEEILQAGIASWDTLYSNMMRSKLGLTLKLQTDLALIEDLENVLILHETDMTIFFRNLSKIKLPKDSTSIQKIPSPIIEAFYDEESLKEGDRQRWLQWFDKYFKRLHQEKRSTQDRAKEMDLTNPKYVLRNYMAQLAIDQANQQDYQLMDEIHQLLKNPYSEQVAMEKWFVKRPEWARNKVGCSMLSCSS